MTDDGLPGKPVQPGSDGILTVGEVTSHVKKLLDGDELLQNIIVRGEISNFTRAKSGHLYFSLKDENSQLNCVCFRGAATGLKFEPDDGVRVIAGGNVTVYERAGRYQLIVRFMRPDGMGELAVALQKLKKKLDAEGLFEPSRKRKLPKFPRVIAICTSPTGAAVRDMTGIIARRYPPVRMIVIPTVVQGDAARDSIIRSLQIADNINEVDVIIVGRGGGSIEDLWAFNLEPVARAIFASEKPVVSAVGHETDTTIADMVADARAATPSMAAEIVTPDQRELTGRLQALGQQLTAAVNARIGSLQRRYERVVAHPLLQRPQAILQQRQITVDELGAAITQRIQQDIQESRARLEKAEVGLNSLSPFAVIERGYAICRRHDGTIVTAIGDTAIGDDVSVTVTDGDILAQVTDHERAADEPKTQTP